jgi:signal transduction histidine kinase
MTAEVNPVELLGRVFPSVDPLVLAAIARLSQMKTYPKGTVLCQEGETGDTFYLIAAGEVEITKKMSDAEDRLLRRGGRGEFFGEMALLRDTVRSATVRTASDTTVLELDRTTFIAAIQQNPSMVLTLIRTMIDRMRANDAQALADLRAEKDKVEAAYEELQRQEQKRNEFLDTLAHELRTPLTAAKGYIDLLKVGVLQGPALSMGVDKVNFYFNRIISLINDLLFVQEMELLDFGFNQVNVLEVLNEVIDQMNATGKPNPIYLEVGEDISQISADHDGLLRVFTHLLDNAIKFSPEGGPITVRVVRNAAHYITIEFIDQGVGIPPEFMPRLFERFERVETYKQYLFGGLGLGLPIVKHIIDRHGGTINVKSERGKGSIFTIHLPVATRRTTLVLNLDAPEWIDVPEANSGLDSDSDHSA